MAYRQDPFEDPYGSRAILTNKLTLEVHLPNPVNRNCSLFPQTKVPSNVPPKDSHNSGQLPLPEAAWAVSQQTRATCCQF